MKICIDAGHGMGNRGAGYDPGAVAAGVSEADITLLDALTAKHVLPSYGFEVFLTRDDATDVTPVSTRDDKAERAGCKLMISLHCNAADSKDASGTESFVRDTRDRAFAVLVQRAAVDTFGGKDRGIKPESDSQHDRLAVLDFDGPCCLLEMEFITNKAARAQLLSRDRRVMMWQRIGAAMKAAYLPA